MALIKDGTIPHGEIRGQDWYPAYAQSAVENCQTLIDQSGLKGFSAELRDGDPVLVRNQEAEISYDEAVDLLDGSDDCCIWFVQVGEVVHLGFYAY